MKRLAVSVCYANIVVMIFALGAFAQDFQPATPANARSFLGKWEASFQGKVFLTLILSGDGNKLKGTMSGGNVEVNDAGELTKAEATDALNTVTDARVNGKRLRISTKNEDGSEDSIDAEIVLLGADTAELRLIVPADVPRPKPWKLTRVPQS
jgi:hypothetical protein